MPANGIAMTGAGELPCSKIFHIDANPKTDWANITNNVFAEANRRAIRSIAFPALGTGKFKGLQGLLAHFWKCVFSKIVANNLLLINRLRNVHLTWDSLVFIDNRNGNSGMNFEISYCLCMEIYSITSLS